MTRHSFSSSDEEHDYHPASRRYSWEGSYSDGDESTGSSEGSRGAHGVRGHSSGSSGDSTSSSSGSEWEKGDGTHRRIRRKGRRKEPSMLWVNVAGGTFLTIMLVGALLAFKLTSEEAAAEVGSGSAAGSSGHVKSS